MADTDIISEIKAILKTRFMVMTKKVAIPCITVTCVATYLVTRFFILEKPEAEHHRQVDNFKAEISNYQSLIKCLEQDKESLKNEIEVVKNVNNAYNAQLEKAKINPKELSNKLEELAQKNSSLGDQLAQCNDNNKELRGKISYLEAMDSNNSVLQGKLQGLALENKNNLEKLTACEKSKASVVLSNEKNSDNVNTNSSSKHDKDQFYNFEKNDLKKGQSFLDPRTKASVGLQEFYSNGTAKGQITLPGKPSGEVILNPGQSFEFDYKNSKYRLMVTKIDWVNSLCSLAVLAIE
jgi:hypothetical protein